MIKSASRYIPVPYALLLLCSGPALSQDTQSHDGHSIVDIAKGYEGVITDLSHRIWKMPEVGFKEEKSSALLQSALRKEGFSIGSGVADMPTAFVARYRTGDGPVMAFLAEFDALPGISQQAEATAPSPVIGENAGHACGHNLLGAGSIGAALAVRQWMAKTGFKGEVRVYGTPAEEGGDGKVYMVRAGLFDDVDAVLHWHPYSLSAVINATSRANIKTDFTFHGISSHAAIAPEKGRSALAGIEIMNVAVNYMRQFIPESARVHGVVTNGGEAPNVIPSVASSSYYVRDIDVNVVKDVQGRLLKTAEGAAIASGTSVEWTIKGGVYPLLINDTLNKIAYKNLKTAASALAWDEKEHRYAESVQKSLGMAPENDPALVIPLAPLPPGAERGAGSTDVGDVSVVVPTVGVMVMAWPQGVTPHSWAAAGASGNSIGTKAAVTAATALAMTAVDLFQSPEALSDAKKELLKKRGQHFRYEALLGNRNPLD